MFEQVTWTAQYSKHTQCLCPACQLLQIIGDCAFKFKLYVKTLRSFQYNLDQFLTWCISQSTVSDYKRLQQWNEKHSQSPLCHIFSTVPLPVKQLRGGKKNCFLNSTSSEYLPDSFTSQHPSVLISQTQRDTTPLLFLSFLCFWICFLLLLADSVLHHPVKIHICWT